MRVLFWGTPEFATAPLRALIGEGFDVVGVVTQPDKAVGRSRSTLQPSAVKRVALAERAVSDLRALEPVRDRYLKFKEGLKKAEVQQLRLHYKFEPKAVRGLPRRLSIALEYQKQ